MTHEKEVTDQFDTLSEIKMPDSKYEEVWDNISNEIKKENRFHAFRSNFRVLKTSMAAIAAVAVVAGSWYAIDRTQIGHGTGNSVNTASDRSSHQLIGARLQWNGHVYKVQQGASSKDIGKQLGKVSYHGSTSGLFTVFQLSGVNPVKEVIFQSSDGHYYDAVATQADSSTKSSQSTSSFGSVHMVTSTVGWAVSQKAVWRTQNSGTTWTNMTPSGMNTAVHSQPKIYVLDNKHIWLAVPQTTTDSVLVFRTSDGGTSWSKTQIKVGGQLGAIRFMNQTQGWLWINQGGGGMGKDEVPIYQTNDGGASWKRTSKTKNVKTGTLPTAGSKLGVTFIDTKRGWITGDVTAHGVIYLYRAADGGKTWSKQKVPLPSQMKKDRFESYPPVFFNKTDGVLPVEAFGGPLVIYQTTDGGTHWTSGTPLKSNAQGGMPQKWKFDFVSNKVGFASDGKELCATKNNGRTWKVINTNVPFKNISQLDFTSSSDGWALMTSGSLYRTTDGGHVWQKIR